MLTTIYQIVAILGGGSTFGALLFLAIRGGYYRALAAQWKEVAEERQALANVRAEKIQDHEKRITTLEGEVQKAKAENDRLQEDNKQLRQANLRLQGLNPA